MVGAKVVRDRFCDGLWSRLDELRHDGEQRLVLLDQLRDKSVELEKLCSDRGVGAQELETPTRQVYCWLRFLSLETNLELHLDALYRVRSLALELGCLRGLEVHLINMGSLWRYRSSQGVLCVHEGMISADRGLWRALLRGVFGGPEEAGLTQAVRTFALSESFRRVNSAMECFAEAPERSRGLRHDLMQSFLRVNERYFGGSMERPRLAWTRRVTSTCFGTYDTLRDLVTVSLTLDDDDVPPYVVDFVMYHELLHKKHGSVQRGKRRFCHTPEFRRDERLFLHFDRAEAHLQGLVSRGH